MPPCYPPSKWPLAGQTQLVGQDLTEPSFVLPSQETVEVCCILIKCMVINDCALAVLSGSTSSAHYRFVCVTDT